MAVTAAGVPKWLPDNPTVTLVQVGVLSIATRAFWPGVAPLPEDRLPPAVHLARAATPDVVEALGPAVHDAEGPFAAVLDPMLRHRPVAAAAPARAASEGAAVEERPRAAKKAGAALLLQGPAPVGAS